MDFWATAGIVVRRWYAVLPVLLACVATVGLIYSSLPTTYISRSVMLVTSPARGGTQYATGFAPDVTNPLLNSGNGLDLTGTVLIQAMRTSSFATTVGVPEDGSVVLTINNGSDNPELLINGPFVLVEVESADPATSQTITQHVVDEAHRELQHQQVALGAPASTFVTLTEIVPATLPEPFQGNRLRAAGAALALGLILSLASGFACESVLLARRARLATRARAGSDRAGLTDGTALVAVTAERRGGAGPPALPAGSGDCVAPAPAVAAAQER